MILKRDCENYRIEEFIDPFVLHSTRLGAAIEDFLEDHEDSPVRKEVLEFYFAVSHFLEIVRACG